MSIRTRCPNPSCRKEIGIAEKSIGKRVICPFCKKRLIATAPSAVKPETQVLQEPPGQAAPPRGIPKPPQPASSRRPAAKTPPGRQAAPGDREIPRPEASPLVKALRITSLTFVVIVVIAGVIVLAQKFSAAMTASSPQEIFSKLVKAVRGGDDELLWRLLSEEDRTLAQTNQGELRTFLIECGTPQDEVSDLGPEALLMACLRSSLFNVDAWEFRSPITRHDSGEIIFDDKSSGKSHMLAMDRPEAGWRLKLTEFCLEKIRAAAAPEARPPAPDREDNTLESE